MSSNSKENTPKNILSKTEFVTILKEVHLEKASFELNKTKDMEDKGTLWAQDKMSNKDFKKYLKGQGYDVDLRQRDTGYLEIYDRISGNPYKLDL